MKICPGEDENCEEEKKEIYIILSNTFVLGFNIS